MYAIKSSFTYHSQFSKSMASSKQATENHIKFLYSNMPYTLFIQDSPNASDAILQDIASTISLACGCNVTTGNFINSSLQCSPNVLDLVATFAFSNPEGTQLASSVLETTGEWIRGTRKMNQTVYQLDTGCPITTVEIECTSQSQVRDYL